MSRKAWCLAALAMIGWTAIRAAPAAPPVVLGIDLRPLIAQSAGQRERFAVDVPRSVEVSSDGRWSRSASARVWSYTLQIPGAVSMSFHASGIVLPPSAALTVSGSRASVTYRTWEVRSGELWSRPLIGDTLTLRLSVSPAEARLVQFRIDSFQAGYRGLGGIANHPYFDELIRASGTATQSCSENYSCDATAANEGPAHATVAVLVGNKIQCTGTLLNNTRADLAPYVLTARHCQTDVLGGGAPQAAASMSVYWDAVSPCGATLSSIYDGSAPVQSGATTLVEQQDAWLVRLQYAPVVNDAFWAGWDATGSTFFGGYSVHHALGNDKQFTQWYGQALYQQVSGDRLKVGYDSDFWGLVNDLGSVGGGSSGGAVFNTANRLVGSGTLAALQNGQNTPGICPTSPPVAPTPATITAQYTALTSVYASTADSTSTTGNTTLQSVLDPIRSGRLSLDGVAILPVTLTASDTSLSTSMLLTLSWDASGSQSCTASGGISGDGWAGAKSSSGSESLTSAAGGQVSYSLQCSGPGVVGSATANIAWIGPAGAVAALTAPSVQLSSSTATQTAGKSVTLTWASENASSCAASGGTSDDGWSGNLALSGSMQIFETTAGDETYAIACSGAPSVARAQVSVNFIEATQSSSPVATDKGGGGAIDLLWLLFGCLLVVRRLSFVAPRLALILRIR